MDIRANEPKLLENLLKNDISSAVDLKSEPVIQQVIQSYSDRICIISYIQSTDSARIKKIVFVSELIDFSGIEKLFI
ncbi:MAG: hypothetical protein M3Z63_00325 [Gilliamella apicola]|nr:hypothetical protein [Gilliamella apicola]